MSPYELLVAPFADFAFMRRALVACFALALGAGPIGVMLLLRRMSLMGDAVGHAVLPGAAIGYAVAGLSLPAMSFGGFVAGLATALLAGLVARVTPLREDASFAAFYLVALALGVAIVSSLGGTADLLHVLFGSVLAVGDGELVLIAASATLTLLLIGLIYRPLVVECFDPGFLRALGGGATYHMLFLALVVINLVAAFQVMGTLMAVGLLMLPAAAARFWSRELWPLGIIASAVAFGAGLVGLLISYHAEMPVGPAIVLSAGVVWGLSMIVGPFGSIRAYYAEVRHLQA